MRGRRLSMLRVIAPEPSAEEEDSEDDEEKDASAAKE